MRKYEEERDKISLDIVTTFLTHTKPIDDFPLEMRKESVTKSKKEWFEIVKKNVETCCLFDMNC